MPRLQLDPRRRELLAQLRSGALAPSCVSEPPAAAAPTLELAAEPPAAGGAPLSFAPRRRWFLDQLAPGNPFYNINSVSQLPGAIEPERLAWALNRVVARHDSLRTRFATEAGEPVQVVDDQVELEIPVIDLRTVPAEQLDAETMRLAEEEGREPFDLRRTPLLRAKLLRLGEQRWVFLMTLHHIVCDGWSSNILVRELSAYYASWPDAALAGLEPLPLQYADFARRQAETMHGAALERELDYWRGQLDELPTLALPLDHPRPPAVSYRGANYDLRLPKHLGRGVKALGRSEGATSFMVLLAAFYVVLHRYTGQRDLVVGTPIAGRSRTELEGLIGFFANTIVLRLRLGEQPLSFRALVREVRAVALGAYGHQELPFEVLVEQLQPERDLSRNPLFQVLFQVITPLGDDSGEATAQVSRGTAIVDLALHLVDGKRGLWGVVEYSTDLFEEATIASLARSLECVLEAVVAEPDAPLAELPVIAEADAARLSQLAAGGPAHGASLVQQMAPVFSARASEPALRCGGQQWSYAELDVRARSLAAALAARGVGPRDVVAIHGGRSPELVAALWATLRMGAVYLPVDPNYPLARRLRMLADAEPRAIIELAPAEELAECGAARIAVDELAGPDIARMASAAPAWTEHEPDPADLLYAVFTSGSTGRPKGIAMGHGPIANLIAWQRRVPGFAAHARTLMFASPSFDVSIQEMLSTLASGGCLVIPSDEERLDPPRLWQRILDEGVERCFLPVAVLHQLAGAAPPQLGDCRLREVICAGEQLTISAAVRALFARLPGCRLSNHYGPAETHVVTALDLEGDPANWPKLPAIGHPLPGCQLRVVDELGRRVPPGASGELLIGGACVARGYLAQPELTAARFVSEAGTRWYRSGDRVRWRSDGALEFLGRADGQIKIHGYRVEPGEIESCINADPGVAESRVVVLGEGNARKLVAYLVAREASAATRESLAALRRRLHNALPVYMIPSAFVPLERLPLTQNGKLDRAALPPPGQIDHGVREDLPQTDTETAIAELWAKVLELASVGVHDNFFTDLGGHSLLATQLVAQLRDAFAIDLPLGKLFEAPTVASLAEVVDDLLLAEFAEG